jgi:hypothetical protein
MMATIPFACDSPGVNYVATKNRERECREILQKGNVNFQNSIIKYIFKSYYNWMNVGGKMEENESHVFEW